MKSIHLAAAVATALMLQACGGGGNGGGGAPVTPTPSLTLDEVASANPAATRGAAVDAAHALPQFGSVTQSSNFGFAGVTSDAASTTFDGSSPTLRVERPDGSGFALDTIISSVELDTPIPGHIGRVFGLVEESDSSFAGALVATSWSSTNAADYLTAGYWMHMTGNPNTGTVTGVEVGAFTDGPELELSGAPMLPPTGQASYSGPAGGLYTFRYGGAPGQSPADAETGEYRGTITLTADFAAGTLSGNVADITSSGVSAGGSEFSRPVDATIVLGPTAFESDGTFRSNLDSTNARVELTSGVTVTETSGSWGGKFSNILDSAGDPRLVAGTTGAEWTQSDGGSGVFIGTYVASKNGPDSP